ncbi:MAG: hypothetical protein WAV27_07435, partial [Xanthobacteraceae bacterium]
MSIGILRANHTIAQVSSKTDGAARMSDRMPNGVGRARRRDFSRRTRRGLAQSSNGGNTKHGRHRGDSHHGNHVSC